MNYTRLNIQDKDTLHEAERELSMARYFAMENDKIKKSTYAEGKHIHSEVTADPFYSESNIEYLKKLISDVDSGKTKLVEHELIEV